MSPNHEFLFFSTAVTLKIMSKLPNSNHLFVMSQLYIDKNLVRNQSLVHKILCRQESAMPMPTLMPIPMPMPMGSAPKSICPS